MKNLVEIYEKTIEEYPDEYVPILVANKSRIIWQIRQVLDKCKPGGHLLDIGAGIVPFMYICSKLGYNTTIVDDFADDTYQSAGTDEVLGLFREQGVSVKAGNTFSDDLSFISEDIYDLITSHDSMEHWHNSPKNMFHTLWGNISPSGLLWIGVPNCVNLRKRITVPFGYGKWSAMEDWYEKPEFRGHVREPDVADLKYISEDLGASRYEIIGKNWLGYRNPSKLIRNVTPFVDNFLQLRPSLCSDINLFAWK